jgi:membrane-bound inhibitor of C-type lysozyme
VLESGERLNQKAAATKGALMIYRTAVLASALLLAACGSDDAKTAIAPPSSAKTASFDCNGVGRISVLFTNDDNRLQLTVPGAKPLPLALVPSGSGARYADSSSNEFWSKGTEAMLTLSGKTSSCTEAPH